MKKISIFTCIYNEEETVEEVYNIIKNTLLSYKGKYDYEHIFLDNCSTDNTLQILKKLAQNDKKVKILAYSKNFLSIKSEFLGYRYAAGDAVIGFEANLKDPAELIPEFIETWEKGYDVVYGVRNKTKDKFLLGFMRKVFYRLCNFLSSEPLPLNAGMFRLVDRKVVNEFIKLDDYKPYTRGLIASIGFKQLGVNYERKARPRGKSKSNFGYMIDFAINSFVSYSIVPIRICTYSGILLAASSLIMAIAYTLIKILNPDIQPRGIATIVILILFFSGIQLFFLGIIGEYIGAVHSQVRKKPFIIISEKINFD